MMALVSFSQAVAQQPPALHAVPTQAEETTADSINPSLWLDFELYKGTEKPARYYSRMFAIGNVNILDTYLSPEKYDGAELRYVYQDNRPTRWIGVTQTMTHQGIFVMASNRADNNDEAGGYYDFQYVLRYNWQVADHLTLAAGGGIGATLGFLYNMRNSNNPAQARAALNLMPSVAATYDFSWRHADFRLNYEATAPLIGVMFSPNYGQSYYEIFEKGDNDHNIVATTITTTPSLRHILTLDIRPTRKWKRTWFRIGYMGDYQQTKVNNLKYHQYSNLLILGYLKKI